MSNVKNYTDEQLLNKVRKLKSFTGFPSGYWILAVHKKEGYNVFNDKVYLFKGEKFIMVAPATTNAGTALSELSKYNKNGTAVLKTDEWYHNLWTPGLHKGRMRALVQVSPISYYRDNDKNKVADEKGKLYSGIIGINFHTVSYNKFTRYIAKFIGNWSVGCIVVPDVDKYYKILDTIGRQDKISLCLVREF